MASKEYLLRFLIITASFLCIVVSLSYYFFQRNQYAEWLFSLAQNQSNATEEQGFFDRLFDPGRRDAHSNDIWGRKKNQGPLAIVKKSSAQQYGSTTGSTISKHHLRLRETVLAQLILMDRYGLSKKDAWRIIKELNITGAFHKYEENRFLNELLWFKYQDDRKNKSIISALKESGITLTKQKYTFFEDLYSVGVSYLLNGDAKDAKFYLTQAYDQWPARGRTFGNVYLGVLITHAVAGNHTEFLTMIDHIKTYYPDWLYVETFMPDIISLHQIYPDSALLHVLHGRMVQNVEDYASASDAYRKALHTGSLNSTTTRKVNQWLNEIERDNS